MHQILYKGVENDWHNALPLGNGRMGAMVFRKGNAIHIALNHYDCYYKGTNTFDDPARKEQTYEELCRLTEEARREDGYERYHYQRTLHPMAGSGRPHYQAVSYPLAGEVVIRFLEEVDMLESQLTLQIEKAKVIFRAGKDNRCIRMEAFVPEGADGVLIYLEQSCPGLWEKAELTYESQRGLGNIAVGKRIAEGQLIQDTELYDLQNKKGRKLFLAETALAVQELTVREHVAQKLAAQEQEMCGNAWEGNGILNLPGGNELVLAAGALPERGAAAGNNLFLLDNRKELEEKHRKKWQDFWVSKVCLPDSFLETLWHFSLYQLECCSGKNGKFKGQACGLSGLWDIRRPNVWGSMWYWDVNIQTAFQGTFAANHLEISKIFCDAYLSYEKDIRSYTKRIYGVEGWALDYPHPLYNCIQPWCAQFLWNEYLFSGDRNFLEQKAYPVFRDQIAFFCYLAKEDEKGIVHLDPDISPEQGPVSRDSVISLACIRKLITMGISAAKILERPKEELVMMQGLLDRLPAYPESADGRRLKDSALVQDDVFLRHPSVLMPAFPAGEITRTSGDARYRKAIETLRYAAENTELGTFGFSWLACAAAALGEGDEAIRLLYEKGLDHILHSNGLGYEESERFINYCHITKTANYLPAMCEAGGGILSVVNTMLLSQEEDGSISVFPALPKGKKTVWERPQYRQDDEPWGKEYPAWEDCSFSGLLAPGGFEVSACRSGGRTVWIQVTSKYGGIIKLLLPEGLAENSGEYILEKKLTAGKSFSIGERPHGKDQEFFLTEGLEEKILIRKSQATGRRIFLGEDRHTEFFKTWDSFICPYMMGDMRRQQMTPWILDFTGEQKEKEYQNVYGSHYFLSQKCLLYAAGPVKVGTHVFSGDRGYGFDSAQGIRSMERTGPDDIRRDFIEGESGREFRIELPKGKYNLLLVSGDEEESSLTNIQLPRCGLKMPGKVLSHGRYQCKILPFVQEEDGILRLALESGNGMKWKINALIINKEYALL